VTPPIQETTAPTQTSTNPREVFPPDARYIEEFGE
jgi:hypothetical protein